MSIRSWLAKPGVERSLHDRFAIFWVTHVPIAVVAYFLLGFETFVKVSLLYTVLASIWANVASHWTGGIAARSREENS